MLLFLNYVDAASTMAETVGGGGGVESGWGRKNDDDDEECSYAEGVFLSRRVYNSNLVVFICSLVANVVFIILTVILWLNK